MHGGMSRAPRQLQKSPLNSAAAAGRCGLGAALPRPIPPRQAGRGAARGRWAVSAQPQPQAQPQPSVPGSGSLLLAVPAGLVIMAHFKSEQDDWLVVYLKYLLFVFNFFFWAGGAAVMAVGVWTLTEKSGYLGVLASSTFAASAYILISAGTLVMVTGFLGCGAILREQRGCLSMYFCLLFVIFLVELVAGVLAHVYYQRLSDELKQHLNRTLAENYGQPRAAEITASVDRLQQDLPPLPAVQVLWEQRLSGLAAQCLHPVPGGPGPPGARQLLQDGGGTLWPASAPLQHLQGGGRLHHQVGAVPG
ncbi:tetraspanin-11 isoform X4 [Cavia porcellus]|uniref:tetraspanin-11 isoform X4 n=1 Tax=Cavia porcellus TaxID=10141 RepID=UPI002FE2555D